MDDQDEDALINAELKRLGVRYSIQDMYRIPQLELRFAPQLIAALKVAKSAHSYAAIMGLVARQKPDHQTKEEAVELMLKRIQAFDPRVGDELRLIESLIMNPLTKLIGKRRTNALAAMMMDPRFIELHGTFAYLLHRQRTPAAVDCLRLASKNPVMANSALYALARAGASDAAELCAQAIANPAISRKGRRDISETLRMIRAKARKGKCPHVTKGRMPKGLTEWSANLDDEQLPQLVSRLQSCLTGGFAKEEADEVLIAATNLKVERTVTLKFPVTFNHQSIDLWLEMFRDDEDAIDLYVFSEAALVSKFGQTALAKTEGTSISTTDESQ